MPITPDLARDLTSDGDPKRFAHIRRFARYLVDEVEKAFWNERVTKSGAPGYETYVVPVNLGSMDQKWLDDLSEVEIYLLQTTLRELFAEQGWSDARLNPSPVTVVLTA